MNLKDYYKILEIEPLASKSDVKKSFRKLAKIYHPDHNADKNAAEKFIEVYEAYAILSDDQKRIGYDILYEKYITDSKSQFHIQPIEYKSKDDYEYDKYKQWANTAKKDAEVFSGINYRDFYKKVITATYKITEGVFGIIIFLIFNTLWVIFDTLINFIEFSSILFLLIIAWSSFYINIYLGIVYVVVYGLCLYLYLKIFFKYKRLWRYVFGKHKYSWLAIIIYFVFLTCGIYIKSFADNTREKRQEKFEMDRELDEINQTTKGIEDYKKTIKEDSNKNLTLFGLNCLCKHLKMNIKEKYPDIPCINSKTLVFDTREYRVHEINGLLNSKTITKDTLDIKSIIFVDYFEETSYRYDKAEKQVEKKNKYELTMINLSDMNRVYYKDFIVKIFGDKNDIEDISKYIESTLCSK